jgi:hypothetical protein
MRKITALLLIFAAAGAYTGVYADVKMGINGTIEWDTMRINAQVSLDLASAGIRLPAGRTSGEMLLNSGYFRLIQSGLLNLQVDSSSTIADLIKRGELTIHEAELLARTAHSVPPALSPDLKSMVASYSVGLSDISAALLRHTRAAPVARTLNPVSSAQFTGIIIIASENLPIHGRNTSALPIPCLFPKIWDTGMNLIFERNMLDPQNSIMVKYSSKENIFQNNPSGLSAQLQSFVGDRPLRIFARGVYGINPTDLIIDRSDAMLIISSEENRRLLTQGRVVIILDDSVLRSGFSAE